MTNKIITIGRQYASGGRLIAKKLAETLGIPFYDKKLIEMVAKESGLSEEYIAEAEQKRTSSFLYNLYVSSQSLSLSDQVFLAESNVIKQVAKEGPCVIVGRCADYVLRNFDDCIHAFIYAPLEERMQRAEDVYHVEAKDMKSYVLKKDKARASYYNFFTTRQWGKYDNFDLAVNSRLGIDVVCDLIAELAKKK